MNPMLRWMRLARSAGLTVLVGGSVCWAALTIPAATKQGIDYHVATHKIPLYIKAADFVSRHYHYQALADEITAGAANDTDRALAVFAWTRNRIHITPKGWPIVDDHILHIIIRGHGVSDQLADVFATLATYADVPAYWTVFNKDDYGVIPTFVLVDGHWTMFDTTYGFVFRNRAGGLASVEELAADPRLIDDAAGGLRINDVPYSAYVAPALASLTPPHPLRAQLQMPWPRVRYEAHRLIARERSHGSE